MYDRYTIYASAEEISKAMMVEVPESYRSTYNAAPTQLLPVITNEEKRGISFFHWGFMSKWSNSKTAIGGRSINLSSERAFQKTGYKRQIQTKRCIIPMNGFYVWKQVSKKQRVPHYIFPIELSILGVAGLWEEFEDIDGKLNQSFILMTVPSSPSVIEFENEMPAILTPDKSNLWLENEDLKENQKLVAEITNAHPVLSLRSVSPSILDITNNYKELIEPVPASDQLGNYTLFN